tara:strand:+ start:205 stop:1074 length:870 start_codon:yes stop_codon:yes gene_type:complete
MKWQQPQVRLAFQRDPRSIDAFQQAWEQRNKQYPMSEEDINQFSHIVDQIEDKGFTIIPGLFTDIIDEFADNMYKRFDEGQGTVNSERSEDIRNRNNHQLIKNPLYNAPEIAPFVFNEYVFRIAMSYLKCYPAVGTLNLRRSFANDVPVEGVQYYHIDPNSPRFIKFFVYLNDVDELEHGPFTYMEGSNRKIAPGVDQVHRLKDSLAEDLYGKDKVTPIYAKKGDLIIADTTGLHKGSKCKTRDRIMLTINYGIHSEEFRPQNFDIRKDTYDNLPAHLKYTCDFLNIKE